MIDTTQKRLAVILLAGILAVCSTPAWLSAAIHPAKGAYSMETVALRGPETTDIYATFATSDPVAFPIPGALKKMQAKIKDADGEVAFIKNVRDVEVANNTATMSAPEPAPHVTLYVQAHIKTSTKELVLTDQTLVLLRPDLVVENVTAPAEVNVDELFNIDAVIRELNTQVGATATVNLSHGTQLLATVTGVAVDPGGIATVVYAGVAFPDTGTYDLTVSITGADPAEYDDTNNSFDFTVEVVQPYNFQTGTYYFQYHNVHYSNSIFWDLTCDLDYDHYFEHWYDAGLFSGSSSGMIPEAPIESISWSYSTDLGEWGSGVFTDLTPVFTNAYYEGYHAYDPDYGIHFYLYNYLMLSQTGYYMQHYSSGQCYIYYFEDGTTVEYGSSTGNPFMDAHESVTATILIIDGTLVLGGTATMDLVGSHDIYNTSGSYPWGPCPWSYEASHDYHILWNSANGILDPSVLFKGRIITEGVELPQHVSLEGNYPNPFNPSTSVRFALPEGQPVTLVVYDLMGKELARLVDGFVDAGYHHVVWAGRTKLGGKAPTGMYIARLVTRGYSKTIKMVLLK